MLDWFALQTASIPSQTPLLLVLSLLISAVGFYRLVYFVSIGYAFSIAAIAVAIAVLFAQSLTVMLLWQLVLLVLYGLRLGIYLVRREQQTAYNADRAEPGTGTTRENLPRRIMVWVGVSILYVIMPSPALFHAATPSASNEPTAIATALVGLLIMALGLTVEALADQQKSAYKARYPKSFCDTGLYKLVRCPNYLGEITFWLGNFVIGLPYYSTALRWVLVLAGLICIVLIMIGSTKRLEKSQGERYGALPEYQAYIRRVPVLFPFVPVYTLQNVRVYLE